MKTKKSQSSYTKNTLNQISKLQQKWWFSYAWLLFLAIFCFGILITELGFYWDDLPNLYQYTAFGPSGFPAYVEHDRPFSAWYPMLITTLFGYNAIGYHLFMLIFIWINAILIYKICQELWGQNNLAALIIGSITVFYPGFTQQPIALIYSHHILVYFAFLLSIYLMMVYQRNKKKWGYLVLGMFLSLGMFSIENFAILELIRPFILFKMSFDQDEKKSVKSSIISAMKAWVPFLVLFLFFLYWRVFIFSFPTYKPLLLDGLKNKPFNTIVQLIAQMPVDFVKIYFQAWIYNFSIPTISGFGRMATYLFWGLVTVSFFVGLLFILMIERTGSQNTSQSSGSSSQKTALEMFLGAVIMFFFAGAIGWVLGLEISLEFSDNRMVMAFIPSVALFFGSIYELLSHNKNIKAIFFAVLVVLSVGSHFQNQMAYKREWEGLQSFLSQLSWRIPALSENTIFITSDVDLRFYSDSSLTPTLNLMYMDNFRQNEYDHLVFKTYSPRKVDWFADDDYNADYLRVDRSFTFNGNSANTIAFLYRPPGCVQILDKEYANSIAIANLTNLQLKELAFTNLDIIEKQPENDPFSRLFSEDENNSWCYYFEKADLARQFSEFETIVSLGEEAIASGKSPRIASEWLPFLEGYLWNGNLEGAEWIIGQIESAEANYRSGMCYTLNKTLSNDEFPFKQDLETLINAYDCQ